MPLDTNVDLSVDSFSFESPHSALFLTKFKWKEDKLRESLSVSLVFLLLLIQFDTILFVSAMTPI